jgi:hypothetical protein
MVPRLALVRYARVQEAVKSVSRIRQAYKQYTRWRQ